MLTLGSSVNPYGLSNLEKLRSTCGFSVSMKSWSYPKKVVDLNEAKSFNTFRWRLKLGIIHLVRRQNFLKTNISYLLIRTRTWCVSGNIRNISFLENSMCIMIGQSLRWIILYFIWAFKLFGPWNRLRLKVSKMLFIICKVPTLFNS